MNAKIKTRKPIQPNQKPQMNPSTLIFTSFLRILLTYLLLYKTKLPLYIKIVIIITAIDSIDCTIRHIVTNYKYEWDCHKELYQKTDKITDTIISVLLLIYVQSAKNFDKSLLNIITFLLFFRMIGTSLFIFTNNRKYLIYFPNFFSELTLLGAVFSRFNITTIENKTPFYIGLIVGKMMQEFYLHYKSNLLKTIPKVI